MDKGLRTGKRLGWIRTKKYKVADDTTLQRILNPPPPPPPEFKPSEYITGVVNESRHLYKCHEPNCGELFTSDVSLRLHSIKHLNPNIKCTFCGRLSKTEDELSQHCKEFHPDLQKTPGANPLQCKKCNKISRDCQALWRHIRESHRPRIPCPYCEFPFTRPENLRVHIKSKHFAEVGGKEPPKFKCKLCEKEFCYQHSLREHIQGVHRGPEKRLQCKICNSSYSCKASYRVHMRLHLNAKVYPCNVCEMEFKNEEKLKRHLKSLKHLKIARRARRSGKAVPSFMKIPVIKTVTTINRNLTRDQLIDLCKKTVVKIPLKRVDEYVVRIPEKNFISSDNEDDNNVNESAHNSTYLNCCYCDKALPNLEAVKSHEFICLLKIRGKKVHMCPICDKEFDKPYQIKLHLRTHGNERPVQCSHCDATFKSNAAKYSHEKKMHFGIRPPKEPKFYKCDYDGCERKFRSCTSVKTHKDSVHFGIKYPCKKCTRVFSRDDILRAHVRKFHAKSSCPVRLECKPCNRTYGSKTTYLAHLMKPMHLRNLKNVYKKKNAFK